MVSLQRVWLRLSVAVLTLAVVSPCMAQTRDVERVVPESRAELQLSFAPVVKRAAPAVVNIYTSRTVQVQNPFMNDPLFRHFFRGFGMEELGERKENSLGSGVIIDDAGLVVTSNHVIQNAQEVKVVLNDRREFDGRVLIQDPNSDLALLRIEAEGEHFPYLPMRDSDMLEVGDVVLAIGNPFGVGQTVTSGIISALARTTVGISNYQFFIQTDAAINPGNSGGALVDMQGNLIGVNTAIYSTSGASNGIGFAIPSNMVQTVVASASSGQKRVVRPWLGIRVQRVTQEIAESIGMRRPQGVLITEVADISPASQGGIAVGDVVLSVNGKPVDDEQSLHFRFATSKMGEQAIVKVRRKGTELERRVKMVPPPETPKRDVRQLKGAHPFNAVAVANLSPAVASEFNMDVMERGVVVLESQNQYFRKGDIIMQLNGQAMQSTQHLATALQKAGRQWNIVFKRSGRTLSYNLRGR